MTVYERGSIVLVNFNPQKKKEEVSKVRPAVIVSDSFGRPWRRGVVNIALGSSGLPAFVDRRGERDRHGRVLRTTEVAFADSLAALANFYELDAQALEQRLTAGGYHYHAASNQYRGG